jgi:uncharacterized protein (PEP-CTERM system associated)
MRSCAHNLRLRPLPAAVLLLGGLLPGLASAQEEGGASSGTRITPRLSVTQTLTDNLRLQGDEQRDAASITTVSPGLLASSRSGMLRGTLDYSLDGVVYTKTEQKNQLQHRLNTRGTAELIDAALFVDVQGNISRQSVSAFGLQSPDSQLQTGNQTEVRSLSVSPYWRASLPAQMSMQLRGDFQARDTRGSSDGDVREQGGSLNINGPQGRALTWGLQAYTRRVDFRRTGDSGNSTATGQLNWQPDVDWTLGASAGYERSDYELGSTSSSATYGLKLGWTPSPRTTLAADWQRHSYGNGHNFNLQHRMSRLVLRVSSVQSISTSASQSGQLSNYELFNLQFSALEPDATKRDQLVRAALQSLGLSADAITGLGFLSNSVMLQKRNEVSLAYQGQRLTLTLAYSDSNSRAISELQASGSDDLSSSSRVHLRGVNLNLSYRVTPLSTGTLGYSQQHNRGDSGVVGSQLRALTANWTARLGQNSDLTLGLRHTRSEAQLNAYRENALFAQWTQRF